VTLAQARTFVVQVVNAVNKPGAFPARAIDRVASIIERAGGVGPGASIRRVEIRRRDGKVLQADLLLYKLTGDVRHNPYLLDGDVVRVPFEELVASIDGAVNRPGRYELIGTKDLAELVEMAGGLAPNVTRQVAMRLVRVEADDRPDFELVEFGPEGRLPALPLKHEDAIHVPGFGEIQQSVMVMGAINAAAPSAPPPSAPSALGRPGSAPTPTDESASTRRLPYVKGDTVRTLIDRVGGVGPLADLSGSYILRGGKSVPVDLRALIMLKDLSADRAVELGDTLVIPFKRQSVLVQGAVFAPGAYAYNPNYGIDEYVSLAGGPNRFGQSVKAVRVIGPGGDTRDYSRDLKIEPGSQLVIPERSFSSPEIVQIIISVASVFISGVAVVLAAKK
jgi:protein involved in polysaccharide export with SLBB domain